MSDKDVSNDITIHGYPPHRSDVAAPSPSPYVPSGFRQPEPVVIDVHHGCEQRIAALTADLEAARAEGKRQAELLAADRDDVLAAAQSEIAELHARYRSVCAGQEAWASLCAYATRERDALAERVRVLTEALEDLIGAVRLKIDFSADMTHGQFAARYGALESKETVNANLRKHEGRARAALAAAATPAQEAPGDEKAAHE